MTIEVHSVLTDTPEFQAVWDLYRSNSSTLGFMPRGGFEDFAATSRLIAAARADRVVGYAAWRVTGNEAILAHFCVDGTARRAGVATALMHALVARTQGEFSIRLSCRQEYPANALWPRFGFRWRGERAGRGEDAAALLLWERPNTNGLPLLQAVAQTRPRKAHVAAMDANVFFDFHQSSPNSDESRALLADWIDDMELCVTAELANEISRRSGERTETLLRSRRFRCLEALPDALSATVRDLTALLPPPHGVSDESDRRQVGHAIVGGADFFVTRDTDLLDHADSIQAAFEIEVLRPCDVLVRLQDRTDRHAYAPVRLAGTRLEQRRALGEAELLPFQRFARRESKGDWLSKVRSALARPDTTVQVVGRRKEPPRVAFAVDRSDAAVARIVFLRALSGALTPTLLRRVVADVLQDGLNGGRALVRFDDPGDPEVDRAIVDVGFDEHEGVLQRRLHRGIVQVEKLREVVGFEGDARDAERRLWPLKVIGADIQSWIIPIKPPFASALFDELLAEEELFSVEERPALALENVYYSASKITIPTGARILWYVSSPVKAVRACSVCLETVVGPVKDLFRRFQRLGTWKWRQVLAAAGGDPTAEMRAYRFASTEVFGTPQPFAAVQRALLRHQGKQNQFMSPVVVREPVFVDLYHRGVSVPDPNSPASLLVSLSPEYATMIARGTKTVELRRRFSNVSEGTEMWIYETLPTGAITGRVEVKAVTRAPPAALWNQFGPSTGISRPKFDEYFARCDEGVALTIASHQAITPIPLEDLRRRVPGFVVPQSYRYLDAVELGQLTNRPHRVG